MRPLPSPFITILEIFADCGYLTESLPGVPEHQEPLQQMEAGACGEDLQCYLECMLAVHEEQDGCWHCEFTDAECMENPTADCPRDCEP